MALIALALATPVEAQPVTAAIAYAPAQRCTPYVGSINAATAAQQQRADALIAAFETSYPAALVDPARVEGALVTPSMLQAIVLDLACLATQPGADPFVPEQAAALFASRRYGVQAFALLAKANSAHAGRFARQMRNYVASHR